jgi:ATP-dependent RNA helicase DeaD
VTEEGYETPTPIQARAIPLLLEGRDLVGQAQTGTGKTAAFALPLLCRIEPSEGAVQALVLVPTRELALQVAQAIHTYGRHLRQAAVLAIYGGDSMVRQIARLERGVQVVVGTPGRVLDHIRRGSLQLGEVRTVVLDEADEMLRMGFIEDVESILSNTPEGRQTALFSATMPPEIQRVARNHLRSPVRVAIEVTQKTVESTVQRFAVVADHHKLEALLRLLEVSPPEAALVFARTRIGADELAEALCAHGFPAEALHSDLSQAQRATVLQRLRDQRLRIVVATDVAARGLDIDHISHVINFDLPGDPETYVHRIGRTGRAGRTGDALLLVTPKERGRVRALERYTQSAIPPLAVPTRAEVQKHRAERLAASIGEALKGEVPDTFRALAERLAAASETDGLAVAAVALSRLCADRIAPNPSIPDDLRPTQRAERFERPERFARSERPERPERFARPERFERPERFARPERPERFERPERSDRPERFGRPERAPHSERPAWSGPRDRAEPHGGEPPAHRRFEARPQTERTPPADVALLLLAVGHQHGLRPQDVVGAIANEAGVPGKIIGHIDIHGGHCTVEIPAQLGVRVVTALRRATIRGQFAKPRLLSGSGSGFSTDSGAGYGAGRDRDSAPPQGGFRPPRRAPAQARRRPH